MSFDRRRRKIVQVGLLPPRSRSKLDQHGPNSARDPDDKRSRSAASARMETPITDRPSKFKRDQLLARMQKTESFCHPRRSIINAKNKKEILAIIAPSLQEAQDDLSADPQSPVFKWSLREIAGIMPKLGNGVDADSQVRVLSARRNSFHYIKGRVNFESQSLQANFEGIRSRRSLDDGEVIVEDGDDDDDDDAGTDPVEALAESMAQLHQSITAQLHQMPALRRELDLNYELLMSCPHPKEQGAKDKFDHSSDMNKLFESLRLRSKGDHGITDPRQLKRHQDLISLNEDIVVAVKDINAYLAEVNHQNGKQSELKRSSLDPARSVEHMIHISELFRRALRTVMEHDINIAWALETCWKGATLTNEACLARETAFIHHVNNQLQNVNYRNIGGNNLSNERSSAVAKLQDSFDNDVLKKRMESLQNELYEMKKENISLRSRVKASELLTRQRLISHLYHDDEDPNQPQNRSDEAKPSFQHGEPQYFPIHVPTTAIVSGPRSTGPISRRSIRSENTTPRPRQASMVNEQDEPIDHEREFFSARSIGLERMSLPSTTLSPVAVDLVLGRVPQVITHALNVITSSKEMIPPLSHTELYRLSIEALVESTAYYGYTPEAIVPSVSTPILQFPDFLLTFFQLRYGTKKESDVQMGRWFCFELQQIQLEDIRPSIFGTLPLLSIIGKLVGLAKSNLHKQAFSLILFGFAQWHCNEKVKKIYFEAQRDLFETKVNGLMTQTGNSEEGENLEPKEIGFFEEGLLIPLDIAEDILQKTHKHFQLKTSIEIGQSHLEGETVLADGSNIGHNQMHILLTMHHIHRGIEIRTRIKELKVEDIESLFRRFDARRCGRMPLLQFISCIRNLRCGVSDDEIHAIVRLFDTSSKRSQEVDYKKFAKFFSPVTLFVSVDTMVSSLITMWSNETATNESEAMRKFVCNDFKQRISELNEFTAIIQSMKPDITVQDAAIYFQECLDISGSNFVTRSTFLAMTRTHCLFNNLSH